MYLCQSDLLAAGVLQYILGAAPLGYIKWGCLKVQNGHPITLKLITLPSVHLMLGKAAAGAVDVPFAVS